MNFPERLLLAHRESPRDTVDKNCYLQVLCSGSGGGGAAAAV